ncbi:MAG: hypothetical protein ABEK59_07365 [Halobacteria archaeon]
MKVIAPGPDIEQELINPPNWVEQEIIEKWGYLKENYDWLAKRMKNINSENSEISRVGIGDVVWLDCKNDLAIRMESLEMQKNKIEGLEFGHNAVWLGSLDFKDLAKLTQEGKL